jgi:flagellar basal body-associated protein FliL
MQTNKKKSKNIIGIIQSVLILILVVLIIFMMIQISRLQGTARVINYAGLERV